MKLTNRNIVFAKPGRHHAGVQGLYLYVSPDGKVRRFLKRYTSPETGRVTETGLGLWPAVSLEDAQAKALELSRQVAQGICPITAKRAARATAIPADSFGELIDAWLDTHKPGWRSASQLHNMEVLLYGHGKPLLHLPVNTITSDMIQAALSELWSKHPNQGRRALNAFARIFDFAKARGICSGDNPAAWRGCHEYRFPRRTKMEKNHYNAMVYTTIPKFVLALVAKEKNSTGAAALEFLILTAARTNEVRTMRWDEIDWEAKVWTLAADRTKQGRVHQVPLSNQAMVILTNRRDYMGILGDIYQRPHSPYVFTGWKQKRPLSSKAMHHVLNSMGVDVTVHGFRSTFRDWCGDETEFAREHVEACLGHAVGNGTEQAYRRGTALEKRRVIMQAWADFCHSNNSLPKAEVKRNLGDDDRRSDT
jgi:integrase